MEMMAIATSSSISVNARRGGANEVTRQRGTRSSVGSSTIAQ